MESRSTMPWQSLNDQLVQNFHLVWLDGSIDEINNDDCRNSITKLRQVVNTIDTFTDIDECIDFITDTEDRQIFMISSGVFSQIIVPVIQNISHVGSLYIFCENTLQHEKWAQQWSKVKGVFTDITHICEALKQTAQDSDRNSVTIHFVKSNSGTSDENLDQLDQSFMYTQLVKEILLTIDFQQEHIDRFLMYCREKFVGNTAQLNNIDKLEKDYYCHSPIWWYTSDYFLYSMLNRALRTMEVDLIVKMGFFVQDLHQHIATLHAEQYGGQSNSDSFTVYRGQGLSQADFHQLKKTQGGLMSFNNFLSTSLDRAVSHAFAESNQDDPDLIGVLFEININPSITSTYFARIHDVSAYQTEEDILFSMHSVFRIGQVGQIDGNNRLWQVDLTLTSDNDPQLHALSESMREETEGSKGWFRLGQLMITLGQYDKAEELYETLVKHTNTASEKGRLFYQLGSIKNDQENYTEAIILYEKSLEILEKTLPPNHLDLSSTYNSIGLVYNKMAEYSKALSYHEKALEIQRNTPFPDDDYTATSYNHIGFVYNMMGKYSNALLYYEKSIKIRQKTLPPSHPKLATCYNNIGEVYRDMAEYSKALTYYEKALEIRRKTLPENHPDLVVSYNSIGVLYQNMNEYEKSLSYHEKALEIQQKTFPLNHPRLASSYNNIGVLYREMDDYKKALSYYEKSLAIYQKTLPPYHPDLAMSYRNIGLVYDNMGEYTKALSSYEKAFEICHKTLPSDHPDWGTSYNNIGGLYYSMGEYSKALSYYEKALAIFQKTLPPNHPDLVTSYNNMGVLCDKMREYSKALSHYKKVLEIRQQNLPSNHPHLASSFNNIGWVYRNICDYSQALSYYERALVIWQHSLPPNHPDLQSIRETIEFVKTKL